MNEEVRIVVLQKRIVFEQWLQQGTEQAFEEYRDESASRCERSKEAGRG